MAARYRRLSALALLLLATGLAGCGPPPQVAPTPEAPLPEPHTPGPTRPAPTTTATPSPAPPPVQTPAIADCGGQPDAFEILITLESVGLLAADTLGVEIAEGPLCADDWQYTRITVPDRDPLQVVTSGAPGALTLVTAGTDVCTIEVRVQAPAGIHVAAGCVG